MGILGNLLEMLEVNIGLETANISSILHGKNAIVCYKQTAFRKSSVTASVLQGILHKKAVCWREAMRIWDDSPQSEIPSF